MSIFSTDYKAAPYWWDETPLQGDDGRVPPPRADVVVIGAGYTGLHAALVAARCGRSVAALDAEAAGAGCSTRNGGQISTSIKPGFAQLSRRHGEPVARRIMADGAASLSFIENFVKDEEIACDFGVVGRFHAAHSPRAFQGLKAAVAGQHPDFAVPAEVIPRDDQRAEIGTDAYHGGVIYGAHASINPGLYHAGLLARVRSAGANIIPFCAATGISGQPGNFSVATPKGTIQTRDIVVATNGYTGAITPWQRRRVIPIGSYVIATEALDEAVIDQIIPKNRIVSDTRRVVYYYRASPDRRRIIFGGRVSHAETDPAKSAPKLRAELVRLFPQLEGVRVSHSWMGLVGYTFDTMAHAGQRGGLHYAMGYCGSGVGMASYLGMKTGCAVLGQDAGTGMAEARFPTRPLYRGKPWFLAPAVSWYRLCDRLG